MSFYGFVWPECIFFNRARFTKWLKEMVVPGPTSLQPWAQWLDQSPRMWETDAIPPSVNGGEGIWMLVSHIWGAYPNHGAMGYSSVNLSKCLLLTLSHFFHLSATIASTTPIIPYNVPSHQDKTRQSKMLAFSNLCFCNSWNGQFSVIYYPIVQPDHNKIFQQKNSLQLSQCGVW